eukprot:gene6022-biopygen2901
MTGYKEEDALCVICGMADSQYHWICECKGANLEEERAVMRKDARALAMDILETITVVDTADTETLYAFACSINSYYLRHIDHPVENSTRSGSLDSDELRNGQGYLNDRLDDLKANCRLIKQERRLRVEALRDIPHHEELLLAYGEDYWLNNVLSVDILQQAMVASATGSTWAAWHSKIQKASAILPVQPVNVLEGTMIIAPPMTTAAVSHVAETWGISHSGLLLRCEEKKRKHKQSRDEETNIRRTAQAIQNARTGNCSSTDYDYLKATVGEARVVEQRESSTTVGPERCPPAVQAPMRYYMTNNYTSNLEGN